jgi:hypothetical protein
MHSHGQASAPSSSRAIIEMMNAVTCVVVASKLALV